LKDFTAESWMPSIRPCPVEWKKPILAADGRGNEAVARRGIVVFADSRRLSEPPRKVVLVQTAFIGDVVFVSPLVHAIKQTFPQSSVSLLVRPSSAEVAQCIPGVDRVLTFDKRGEESGPLGTWRAAQRIRREKYDLLVSPHRSARTAALAWLSGVPLRVGYKNGLGRMAYHIAVPGNPREVCSLTQDFELLKKIGIEPAGTRLRLKGPEGQWPYIEEFFSRHQLTLKSKLVALCIGAFWPTKRWPHVYFASLGESLKERGYEPLLFGGPNELVIATKIEEALKVPLISCVGNTLAESAALLQRCQMSVGGDSGLTHMSRALGVPTVLIYGPTDPRMHTFGEKTKVLTAKVKCRPCSRHRQPRCPERHHDCMRLVSPENVLDALREITTLQTPVPRDKPQEQSDQADAASSVH
jgi:heptosyltransferase-2